MQAFWGIFCTKSWGVCNNPYWSTKDVFAVVLWTKEALQLRFRCFQ